MDWGFGNPNRTATLIAVLMVAIWSLAAFKKWGYICAATVFVVLGVCLTLTFSRGGLVAAAVGCGVLVVFARRPWQRSRVIGAVGCIAILALCSTLTTATNRYSSAWQGDPSVGNRIEVWKHIPVMLVDSPTGWGLGRSQQAYMHWYQGIDRPERFLNLVSLHGTLLAELGWPLRILYLGFWIAGFVITFPSNRANRTAIPLAIWTTVFVAGFFTHFSTSWLLYILPVFSLVAALSLRLQSRRWPKPMALACIPLATLCIVVAIFGLSRMSTTSIASGSAHTVLVGDAPPSRWIVVDESVLGRDYGKTLRRFLRDKPGHPRIALVSDIRYVPVGENVILPGAKLSVESILEAKPKRVTLVNSPIQPEQLAGVQEIDVVVGEFSSAAHNEIPGSNVRMLPGFGEFIPEWPDNILGFSH